MIIAVIIGIIELVILILQKVGLNGKMVYTMLMGFGCSTSATLTSKNMADKNSQIKVSLITPFISCSAKLQIYSIIRSGICQELLKENYRKIMRKFYRELLTKRCVGSIIIR